MRHGYKKLRLLGSALVMLAVPFGAVAQTPGLPIQFGGLLRTGFRAEPASSSRTDGFEVFDARFSAEGRVGIVFDYFGQVEWDPAGDRLRLLDFTATAAIRPEFEISLGLFRPAFGLEALEDRGDLGFLERAQATTAIAPGRQVGVSAGGTAIDGRLTYGAGVFNGNGRVFENDGDNYLFSAQARFNSIGTIAFYDDLVVQFGASLAYSRDTSAELGAGTVTGDPFAVPELTTAFAGSRLLWGADIQTTYREWSLTGEVLRAEYDLDSAIGGGPATEATAYGGYVELGYRTYIIEGLVRYDGLSPALGDNRDFLVFGFNILPGQYTRFGLQYAVGLDDSPNAPGLADGQFVILAQVDF